MVSALKFITDFADSAVMFPLGIALALTLAICRERRAALAWTVAVGAVWAAILVLKFGGYTLYVIAPASPLTELGLITPSGHVASSAVIYGALAGLLLATAGTAVWRSVLAAAMVALVIGTSRTLLGEHSLAESMVGAAVGVAGAAGLAAVARTGLSRRARLSVLGVTALCLLLLHGEHWTAESSIFGVSIQAALAISG